MSKVESSPPQYPVNPEPIVYQPPQPGYANQQPQPGYGYQQPQPGYGYQQPQPNTVVYVNNSQPHYGSIPQSIECPNCRARVMTQTVYKSGVLTWLLCVGLCFIGCDLGCCFIPFCVDGCKDCEHYCPNCNRMVGAKKAL